MVGTPNGSVVRETNFIIIAGPMAQTQGDLPVVLLQQLLQRLGHQALAAVGAVVGADDQLVGDARASGPPRMSRSWVRAPMIEITRLPASLRARAMG